MVFIRFGGQRTDLGGTCPPASSVANGYVPEL